MSESLDNVDQFNRNLDQFNRVERAFEGCLGEDQELISKIGIQVLSTLLKKNSDYGSTVFESPALCPDMSPLSAIMVRMSDKLGRLANLLKDGQSEPEVNESVEDTFADHSGYSILAIVVLHKLRGISNA